MDGRLIEACKPTHTIPPASRNGTSTNGTGVDTRGYKGEAIFTVLVGSMGDVAVLDVKVQESDDDSAYTDVPGAAFAQIAGTEDNTSRGLGIRLAGRKRFLRAVGALTGAGATLYSVSVLLTGAESTPVTVTPASVVVP